MQEDLAVGQDANDVEQQQAIRRARSPMSIAMLDELRPTGRR
jgi:hypothetical protein